MKKIGFIIVITIIALVWYFSASLSGFGDKKGQISFIVESGQALNDVASSLLEQGLIKNKTTFKLYAKIVGKQSRILAGQHSLDKSFGVKQILEILTTGGSIDNEFVITMIEGWRASEMAEYLSNKGIVTKDDFMSEIKTSDWRDDYDFLENVDTKTIEGFLFPDTYRIFTDATARDIVKKMLDTFDAKLTTQMRVDIASQDKTVFEVVILASIVEREVPQNEDKKMIADIFLKRIEAGIPLQSDATVNYVTGGGRAQPTYNDLDVESPYNTYRHRGLPPGPISNPGIGSIVAVIYPTSNPYYYFLTTLDDGTVMYSRTYEEHLNNKAKYLD